ncbi:CCSAP protein, partial [Atractosteus spatula]|nr:CCSAP protein [Atractosteus spatula]
MVAKKIRTEYMKKFKDPKWETYSKCYEDMLKYRVTRRLLEHTHNPWFWEGWDSGSDSSGSSTPQNNKRGEAQKPSEEAPKVSEKEQPKPPVQPKSASADPAEPRVSAGAQRSGAPTERRGSPASPATGQVPEGAGQEEEGKSPGGEPKSKDTSPGAPAEPDHGGRRPTDPRASGRPARSRSQTRQPDAEPDKENRHPFALYGWAERCAETGLKKTHNVRPSASTKEIHTSALRAKTRREVEKRVRTLERRRARSAELDRLHKAKQPPVDNPWMTEYMRCFSARSR